MAFYRVGYALATSTVVRVTAHGAIGGLSSVAGGGSFRDGALGATASSALSPGLGAPTDLGKFATNTAISALAGGTASVIGGGKFANGAVTAAMSYAMSTAAEFAAQEYERFDNLQKLEDFARANGWDGESEIFITGKVPMHRALFLDSPLLDGQNLELLHEHAFYFEGGEWHDKGFWPDGIRKDLYLKDGLNTDLSNFRFNSTIYSGAPTYSAARFSPTSYRWAIMPVGWNCKDFTATIRANATPLGGH